MRTLNPLAVLFAFGCYVPLAFADDASVTISSPADGTKLSQTARTRIDFEVMPGPHGNHSHLYVDGDEVVALHQLKGSYMLATPVWLPPGQHEICIKIATRNHVLIGVQKCIKVSVE